MDPAFLFGDRPDDVRRAAEVLEAAGYTAAGVRRAMGDDGGRLLARGELDPLLRRTRGGAPIDTLVRLFLFGVAVPTAEAERALAPLPLERWDAAGLVEVDGEEVRGLLELQPFEVAGRSAVVAHDQAGRAASDRVMGVAPSSRTLADMTVRTPAARVLDLGTGSGIQALHASAHAAEVVATDSNPRAVAVAAFTMALNGITNVEARQGGLFDPVAGERFGLIVSNPPFVISPETRFAYRDGPRPGDETCRLIVAAAPDHLEEGGWCQLVASWAHTAGVSWGQRLTEWIAGTGCDTWVIQRSVQPVEAYASTWIRHDEPDPATASRTFASWMGYYERSGIEGIGFGLITMRRTSGRTPWLRLEELTQDVAVPCGDAIAAGFDRLTWLCEVGDDVRSLLEARPTVAEDVRLDQRRRWSSEGGWALEESWLRLADGLRYSGSIDAELTALLAGCDGATRLGDLIHALATSIGARPEELAPQVLPVLRQLVERGYLVPPAGERSGQEPPRSS